MMNGGIAHPLVLTASIAVIHFRFPGCFVLGLPFLSDVVITLEVEMTPIWKPVLLSRAGIGVQAVRRYGSRQIGYRAMYVRIGNPVVCSIDRT
jgi:hypothetical protein